MRKNIKAAMRTSEAERQQVADFLRDGCAEGRLGADELEQRLDQLFAGHTVADLEALVWDLPGGDAVLPGALPAVRTGGVPARHRHGRPRSVVALLILAIAVVAISAMPPEAVVGVTVVAVIFGCLALALATVLAPAGFVLIALAWLAGRLWRGRMGPRLR
jgi:hypothetical protein